MIHIMQKIAAFRLDNNIGKCYCSLRITVHTHGLYDATYDSVLDSTIKTAVNAHLPPVKCPQRCVSDDKLCSSVEH